jgi:NAD+ kinase
MAAVLIIAKTPLAARLRAEDLSRLRESGVLERARLDAAASRHEHTLSAVRAAFARDQVRERTIEQARAEDARDAALVVTVGGDGTVFTANTLGARAPLLAVNSDPEHSVGHFTHADADSVAEVAARWRAGRAEEEALPRLEVRVGARAWSFLNDCLFSSENPAAMTRYLLDADGRRERQRSSGVWIATAAGSTAAICSAGAESVERSVPALLYRVREPFQAKGACSLLGDTQLPPRGLRLAAATPGISLYLDGPNITVGLQAGEVATFTQAELPLRFLR